MSVKKRLFWSHILMFALPLAAYWGLSRLLDALLLRYLLAQNYASLWDFQRQVGRAQQVGRLITFVGLVLTLVAVSLLLSRLLLKKINGSLDELSQGLAKLRSGELTYRLPVGTGRTTSSPPCGPISTPRRLSFNSRWSRYSKMKTTEGSFWRVFPTPCARR